MKTTLIYNPVAGLHTHGGEVRETADFLRSRGWDVLAVEETHGHGDATTYAREAVAQGCDAVFMAGGDGTIAQVVDGLVGSRVALAVLPTGTGNVFARQLNLPMPGGLHPRPILESARLLLDGQRRRVDVGRITPRRGNGPSRHFLCWGGVGFDAQVNIAVDAQAEQKKHLGILAFFLAGFLTLRHYAGTSAVVRVDGRRVSRRMVMLVANNIQLYGVFVRMAPAAVLDDGLLDVLCFQGTGPVRTLMHALRAMTGLHIQDPEVEVFQARRVEVSTHRPLPVHVDGDVIGHTPIVIENIPAALDLLVPSVAPSSLFVDGAGMLGPETPWAWMTRMARDAGSALLERSLPQ